MSYGRQITFAGRLTSAIALFTVTVLAVTLLLVYLGARHSLQVNLDSSLLAIARSEIASSMDGPNGFVHVHDERPYLLDPSSSAGYEKYAMIVHPDGGLAAQTSNLNAGRPLPITSRAISYMLDGRMDYENVQHGGRLLRAIYYPMRDIRDRSLYAVVAISTEPMQNALRSLQWTLLAGLVLGGCVVALAAHYLARRLTAPLERIALAARAIHEGNLDDRLPDGVLERELTEVTAALNDMLSRLEQAFASQRSLIAAQRRFIADASHELRSPLSILRGTIEVALRRPRESHEYREALEISLEEARQMARLVEDLLLLSRADSGQLVLEWSDCDLALIAQQAVAARKYQIAAGQVEDITLCLAAEGPVWVYGDGARLRQVVDNLLDNALRHSPSGARVTIRVSVEGNRSVLEVSDQGPGIPQSVQNRIFDRFYRADASRSRDSGGLGLGLSIVKAIVDAHGGSIEVVSAPGEGARFVVTLDSNLNSEPLLHRRGAEAQRTATG